MKRFIFLAALFVAASLCSVAQTIAELTPAAAVNTSGKQRMLTQRMAKDFVLKGMGIQTEQVQKELNLSIIMFEENLKALTAFAPNAQIRSLLEKEESLWISYKRLLQMESNRVNATNLLNANTAILTACDDVVKEIVNYVGQLPSSSDDLNVTALAVARNTNTSGRLRMLSQRLTLYYASYFWGITDKASLDVLKGVSDNVQQSMSSLITSEINTQEIDEAVSEIVAEWKLIEERCTANNCISFEEKNMEPAQMFSVTNRMLTKADRVTTMYSRLLQ